MPATKSLSGSFFQNRIDNAIKYSARSNPAIIHIETDVGDDYVTVCIRDNGVGIDSAYAERHFQLFHRLRRAEEFEGSRVDLVVFAKFVALHHGSIWAQAK